MDDSQESLGPAVLIPQEHGSLSFVFYRIIEKMRMTNNAYQVITDHRPDSLITVQRHCTGPLPRPGPITENCICLTRQILGGFVFPAD